MKIAFLTSGGIAPCLSASIASLIENYRLSNQPFEYIGYLNGYHGLLKGKSIALEFKTNDDKSSERVIIPSFSLNIFPFFKPIGLLTPSIITEFFII